MPCNDWGGPGRTCDGTCNQEYKKRTDQLARMLCGLCKAQQALGTGNLILKIPGLATWWKEHQEADRKRAEYEKKAKADRRKRKEQELQKLAKELGKKVI